MVNSAVLKVVWSIETVPTILDAIIIHNGDALSKTIMQLPSFPSPSHSPYACGMMGTRPANSHSLAVHGISTTYSILDPSKAVMAAPLAAAKRKISFSDAITAVKTTVPSAPAIPAPVLVEVPRSRPK